MRVLIRNLTGISGYQRRLKRDSLFLLKAFNLKDAELSILLVNDREMERLNRIFRGKRETTDVLSFPLYNSLTEIPEDGEVLIGDIVINLKAAARQARGHHLSDREEVRRLLIHGFLHLLGYDHELNRYHEIKMKKKERQLYHALKEMDKECKLCY